MTGWGNRFEIGSLGTPQHVDRFDPIASKGLFGQSLCNHQEHSLALALWTFDEDVFQLGTQRYGKARRKCPRRGRPDRNRDDRIVLYGDAESGGEGFRFDRVIGDVHGWRYLVGIFDLRLGQRRTAIETPVDRLEAAGDVAIRVDLRQRAQHVGFEFGIHRAVGIVPVAEHAEALEIRTLQVDLPGGVLAALLAEFHRIQLMSDLAELLFDGDFDRQPVAVPAGYVGRTESAQQLRLDDDVLEHLVDRVTDMDDSVGIRRAVVQDEGLLARCGALLDFLVTSGLLPLGKQRWLPRREVRLHRECGVGKIDRALVILAHAKTPALVRC